MPDTQFTEKLYTSTEVADILGVSLRSIYRYLDENKLQAEIKTATGRHRFTKNNINDFLHPQGIKSSEPVSAVQPTEPEYEKPSLSKKESYTKPVNIQKGEESVEETTQVELTKHVQIAQEEVKAQDEPVDWLARFRQAAEKYKAQPVYDQPLTKPEPVIPPVVEEELVQDFQESTFNYYRSGVGGLKEIAQSLDKSSKNASLDYAFTMNAGLSLHKPIKPFSLIHAYVRTKDKSYFEKVLQLVATAKDTAQICLIATDDAGVFTNRREMHGLSVVSDEQLKLDLMNEGESELAKELD
ncbi:MAG: hypothetical protein UW82_C0033G0006 [candidate division WWE3 bacterium GW2011_GWC2_44_9]|uniref:Helix-turn-helix domain-containing protein n=1 Tax=candidate division WWE3 bacterium GW2011_GWC2_44_9 TaxID=1619125 RepID=A0A0G1KJQ8_UNCKA|nr:MAG: hypothetical protein UW82_C0033G0006 [candidate division WWE3 bacterium GW2011_GWC2_44_9]